MSLMQALENFSHQIAMQNCRNRYLDHDSSKLLTPELIIEELKNCEQSEVALALSKMAYDF